MHRGNGLKLETFSRSSDRPASGRWDEGADRVLPAEANFNMGTMQYSAWPR